MQNDFEKNINQRLQDFSLPPQPEIWQRVEAALPPQKKRRRILLWWWLPVLILLASGTWWIMARKPETVSQNNPVVPSENLSKPPVTNDSAAPVKDENSVIPDKEIAQKTNSRTAKPLIPVKQNDPEFFQAEKKDKPDQPLRKLNRQKVLSNATAAPTTKDLALLARHSHSNTKQPTPETENLRYQHEKDSGNLNTDKETLPSVKESEAAFQTKKDSTLIRDSAVAIFQEKDTSNSLLTDTTAAPATVVTTKQKLFKNQSGWMLETGFGSSNLHRTITNSDKAFDNLYQINLYSNSQSSGPFSGQLRPFSLPKSSYSFSLGISRTQTFGLHWQGRLALRYQLLSSTQAFGSYTGAQNSSFSNDRFYSIGNTGTYRNQAHQLQLSPRIAFVINPATASPVSFHIGVPMAYNLSVNQLLHDYRQGRTYVQSSAYNTRWLLAAEIGAGIFIRHKIYTGITYQYGLSNVARPALQSNFRWQVWQVRVGLPLFHHSSK